MKPVPLSPEEIKQHQEFIYQCVMGNVALRSPAKFGRELNMTVQELVHCSVATLRNIGQQIERVTKDAGSSSFSADGPLRINGIEADNWVTFLKLQIRIKHVEEDAQNTQDRLKDLEAQIEDLQTPEEKRKKLEEEYNKLKGITTVPVTA